MKKVSLITILMFFVLICPLTVGAVNIIYTASGIFDASHPDIEYYDQKPDPFGYDQKPFILEFTIDSMKPPSHVSENATYSYDTWYVPDRVSFSIDGQAQIMYDPELRDPELRFAKCSDCFGGVGVDSIALWADFMHSPQIERITIGMSLDYGTLGADNPIPPLESIKLSDPSVRGVGGSLSEAYSQRGQYLTVIDNFNARAVPEPATLLLLGSGLVGLAGFGRKKFKK